MLEVSHEYRREYPNSELDTPEEREAKALAYELWDKEETEISKKWSTAFEDTSYQFALSAFLTEEEEQLSGPEIRELVVAERASR